MKMSEKIKRGRENAQVALDAYIATHADAADDTLHELCDLIEDLMHLMETLHKDGVYRNREIVEERVYWLVRDYRHESNPKHAGEEV